MAFNLGEVRQVVRFGLDKLGAYSNRELAVGAEVPAGTWHTVVALQSGCVLFEVKAGPFDSDRAKDMAPWAPEEGSPAAGVYLNRLIEAVS